MENATIKGDNVKHKKQFKSSNNPLSPIKKMPSLSYGTNFSPKVEKSKIPLTTGSFHYLEGSFGTYFLNVSLLYATPNFSSEVMENFWPLLFVPGQQSPVHLPKAESRKVSRLPESLWPLARSPMFTHDSEKEEPAPEFVFFFFFLNKRIWLSFKLSNRELTDEIKIPKLKI